MNSKKYCECVGRSVEDCGCRDVIGEVIAEDNAKAIHPAVAQYAVSQLHTDADRVAELELLNAELWRQNAELTRELGLALGEQKPSRVHCTGHVDYDPTPPPEGTAQQKGGDL